jgi:hypothetical protein
VYISGRTEGSNEGYFIGKLNNNFVNGTPTAFDWTYNVKAEDDDYQKNYHPWDVDSQGRVYFIRGDSDNYNFAAMHRLTATGNLDIVENWRMHWVTSGSRGEFRATLASSYSSLYTSGSITHSAILFKIGKRCNLRSWTQTDYDLIQPDGNGGTKNQFLEST